MKRIVRCGLVAAVPALLALGACSDAGPSADDALINLDVARYVADQTVDDVILMTAEADIALRTGLVAAPEAEPICQRLGMQITCQRNAFSGGGSLTVRREITYYDSLDAAQERYDPLLTASIHMLFDLEGTRETTRMSATIDRERDLWWTGLLGEETERTWKGEGSTAVNRVGTNLAGTERTYDMSSTSTIDDVVIAVPREGTWPRSGTITRHVTVEVVNGLGDTYTRDRTVVIAFNGTQFVSVTINGEPFTLNLETREIVQDR